jgi:2-keto-4-pentenoate hydratase/2-oxohepta-3-ene-1,7-dioic acid hydratase in catechol pathway
LIDDTGVTVLDLIWADALALLAEDESSTLLDHSIGHLTTEDLHLLPSVEAANDVYCVGLNYLDHRIEAADLVENDVEAPIIFVKNHRAIAAPTGPLPLPESVSSEFDFEAELGVVIGRLAVDVAPEDSWRYVAGYCVVNDITARDLQRRHQQWHLGKNIPDSTPVGPWVTARASLSWPPDVRLSLRVNGVEKQNARTSWLIHQIPELVSLLSRLTHLDVGDVIATGTPAGVGFKRTPPEFLSSGDIVEVWIEGVGTLRNLVVPALSVGVETNVGRGR